jgi:hypothetical protein
MHRWLSRGVALVGLLGVVPACLNPDISDEYPLTMEAEALDIGDGGAALDEVADDDPREDDAREDDAEPPRDGRRAPRRFTRGAGPASAQSSSLAAPTGDTPAR